MSKKEELSKAFIKPIILGRDKYLNDDNWELGLDYTDFTGSDMQNAFEAGWDAACEDADGVKGHIKLWKEEFLDKACEFLETYPHIFMCILRSEMIDDFRKAMEE
jgi:hypothetical protein